MVAPPRQREPINPAHRRHIVSSALTLAERDALDALCRTQQQSRSTYIRSLILPHLNGSLWVAFEKEDNGE